MSSKKSSHFSKLTVVAVAIFTTLSLIFFHHTYLHNVSSSSDSSTRPKPPLTTAPITPTAPFISKLINIDFSKSTTTTNIPASNSTPTAVAEQSSKLLVETVPSIPTKVTIITPKEVETKQVEPKSKAKIDNPPPKKVEVKKANSVAQQDRSHLTRTVDQYHTKSGLSWEEFVKMPAQKLSESNPWEIPKEGLEICSKEVESRLTARLEGEDLKWCQWALSPTGGKVQVGKSYGTLGSKDREKYEQLTCNSVALGSNPSCDDAWGDAQIKSWKANVLPEMCGDNTTYTSRVTCRESTNMAKVCVLDNVVLDFTKLQDTKRPGRTDSRAWEKGFFATHCARDEIGYYEQYGARVQPQQTRCDYVIDETVVVYGHDDIRNLGHSMSDFMNVWAMLWLSGLTKHAKDMLFLNMDAIRMGHNYYDDLGALGRHYELQFANILKTHDITQHSHHRGQVCIKRLLIQPQPVIMFTWDGWWQDMRCSFVGPSSLYQRWNLQIRQNYARYTNMSFVPLFANPDTFRILLVHRTLKGGGGGMYSSRIILNMDDLQHSLSSSLPTNIELVVADLALLTMEAQVHLVHSVHMVIGIHGAGIPNSMHMALGTRHCCGVLEIFPVGEFQSIRGYGNMARRMGYVYERFQLSAMSSTPSGVTIPVTELRSLIVKMYQQQRTQSSCILQSVLEDPYFDSVPGQIV